VHLGDGRLGQIAPAPGDLQVDFLLAGEAAMGVGFGKAAPISDRWKIDAISANVRQVPSIAKVTRTAK